VATQSSATEADRILPPSKSFSIPWAYLKVYRNAYRGVLPFFDLRPSKSPRTNERAIVDFHVYVDEHLFWTSATKKLLNINPIAHLQAASHAYPRGEIRSPSLISEDFGRPVLGRNLKPPPRSTETFFHHLTCHFTPAEIAAYEQKTNPIEATVSQQNRRSTMRPRYQSGPRPSRSRKTKSGKPPDSKMETCRGATWGSEFPFCFLREGLVAAAETDERMLIVKERSRMAAESGKSAKKT
jgi:hypothetical protein